MRGLGGRRRKEGAACVRGENAATRVWKGDGNRMHALVVGKENGPMAQ